MKDDGGQAFPGKTKLLPWHEVSNTKGPHDPAAYAVDEGGMSLRDYFAAKAMQAEIITSCSDATPQAARDLVNAALLSGQTAIQRIAFNAYRMADEMLRAREQA